METKKGNGVLVGILVGIIIMLLLVVGLFATNIISFNGTSIRFNDKLKNGTEEKGNNIVKSIKLDDSKDYVYDAEYKYSNKYTEYTRGNSTGKDRTDDYYGISIEIYAKDSLSNLKVPYINIIGADAKMVNTELENLYLKYAKNFDNCAEMENDVNSPGCSQILTYRTYKYDNILSVVVVDSVQSTSSYVFNYHTYNFDLVNGNRISYKDMLSKLNYNEQTILEKMKESIKTTMDNELKSSVVTDLSTACYNSKSKNCYELTYDLLQESIDNNNLLFIADNDGNLNILPILYADFVQNGEERRYLVTITK